MDKNFNFFKSKAKKQNQRPRNNSNKSNSSKASSSKQSYKAKAFIKQPTIIISKKQRDIREAIDVRYQKSKLKGYIFVRKNQMSHRRSVSSHSSDYQQFRRLKKINTLDLKQYHKLQDTFIVDIIQNSSEQKNQSNLKFKLKDKNISSDIVKTEGNEVKMKNISSKDMKTLTPSKISKKADEWKFISIDLKEDISKSKPKKIDMKINTHRSYNVQQKVLKMKPNHSMNKYLDKAGKLKTLNGDKITKARF